MATYVLIPGAASDPWYWHLLVTELAKRGHGSVAVDLPCDDETAGLPEYADAVCAAVGDRTTIPAGDLVVVAHSFGGFTAPLVCDRLSVDHLVLVSAMVPQPGEAPGEWWGNTGHDDARRAQDERDGRTPDDEITLWLHDVPADLAAETLKHGRDQSGTPMGAPWPRDSWPDVRTTFLLCRDDKFFPAEFMRRVVRERLAIEPVEMAGSHHPMLSRPADLADRLETVRTRPGRRVR